MILTRSFKDIDLGAFELLIKKKKRNFLAIRALK